MPRKTRHCRKRGSCSEMLFAHLLIARCAFIQRICCYRSCSESLQINGLRNQPWRKKAGRPSRLARLSGNRKFCLLLPQRQCFQAGAVVAGGGADFHGVGATQMQGQAVQAGLGLAQPCVTHMPGKGRFAQGRFAGRVLRFDGRAGACRLQRRFSARRKTRARPVAAARPATPAGPMD